MMQKVLRQRGNILGYFYRSHNSEFFFWHPWGGVGRREYFGLLFSSSIFLSFFPAVIVENVLEMRKKGTPIQHKENLHSGIDVCSLHLLFVLF